MQCGMDSTDEPYVIVPPEALSPSALQGLLEEFVTREGTEYGARDFLRKLINRMLEGNAKAIVEVRADRMFAFRTAKITENEKTGRVGTAGVDMQNIHRMANDAIAESFGGGWMYGEGLKFLFVSEKGREEILPVLELVVTIGAFALFAPLGYALSATAAAIRYDTAAGHEALTAGLIDPDQIMSQAEAELEMFMSHFEIALLVIPEAGTIAVWSGLSVLSLAAAYRQRAKQA